MIKMQKDLLLMKLKGFDDVIVRRNTCYWKKWLYCRECGGEVEMIDKRIEKHTAICAVKFEPLRS